jgi:hypothetical protein
MVSTGLTEGVILREAKKSEWVVTDTIREAFQHSVKKAAVEEVKKQRESSLMRLTDEEADDLVEQLCSKDLTLPERGNQYTAIMARVAARIAVMHLRMSDQDLLENSDKLQKLDLIARRTLKMDGAVGTPPSNPGGGRTVVNVLATASTGIPPALTGEAGARLEREKKILSVPGALPPVIDGEFEES